MIDRVRNPGQVVAGSDGLPPAAGDSAGTSARELAQRRTGTVEVLLLWHPESDGVELSVHDWATGAGFRLPVAPSKAIDAFYHPYAYATGSESSYRVVRAETMIADG